ncbi:hypothetical protein DCC85_18915 [Paenibacillus sp. CAA11]|uniref:sensor domain-containing diguanylate cyclase n=1 Tax=Paenibacillus sp. CAA11 TaxID=1532905 RepID=UPI000D3B0B29|nr:sensor domain-containing diguanylate cyclase [Paenibacillus sp. CAA11]AWB46037.1 hypothetical protein DCC85_18915 [Paenibacillus sp. CAA11]
MLIDRILFGKPFNQTSHNVIEVLKQVMSASKLFITVNDRKTSMVLKRHNPLELEEYQEQGTELEEMLCNLVCANGRMMIHIPDLEKDPLTARLSLPQRLRGGSFLGIPFKLEGGLTFGTLCAISPVPNAYQRWEISLFSSVAGLLTDVVQLEYNLLRDKLTGLFTPYYLDVFYQNCDLEKYPLGVIYMGLDDFKAVNQYFGRSYGDLLLMQVARRTEWLCGDEAAVLRMEGDSFAVIFPSPTLQGLINRAQALLAALRKIKLPSKEAWLTGSIGIAISERRTEGIYGLLQRANSRMMWVKQGMKNDIAY